MMLKTIVVALLSIALTLKIIVTVAPELQEAWHALLFLLFCMIGPGVIFAFLAKALSDE